MDPDAATDTRQRSAELRGLLAEIQQEHTVNRALMAQELAFLDHLLRLANGAGGYDAGGRPRCRPGIPGASCAGVCSTWRPESRVHLDLRPAAVRAERHQAAQQELETTSNNIGNANTAGYTEESVNLSRGDSADVRTRPGRPSRSGRRRRDVDHERSQPVSRHLLSSPERDHQLRHHRAELHQPGAVGARMNRRAAGSPPSSELLEFVEQLANSPNSAAAKQAVVSTGTALAGSISSSPGVLAGCPDSIPSRPRINTTRSPPPAAR